MLQGEDIFMPATLTDAKIMLFCKKNNEKKVIFTSAEAADTPNNC